MRIVLTTLTIAFFYALTATIISPAHLSSGDIFYSFVMTFGFIVIPLLICICIFHCLLNIYGWTKTQPTMLTQMFTLWLIYNLTLVLINLPDYFRHQNNAGYLRYKSFEEYFTANLLEGVITATIFAIAIPLLDMFFKGKVIKLDTSQTYKQI